MAWWKQSACKQLLFLDYFATLVMTRTKMAARLKASRHDNLLLDRHTAFAMTIRTALGHANSHKCGWRDARLYRFVEPFGARSCQLAQVRLARRSLMKVCLRFENLFSHHLSFLYFYIVFKLILYRGLYAETSFSYYY